MCQVAEKLIAERIITEILNGATAVSIGMRPLQLGFGGMGKALQQKRFDNTLPTQVNQLFMSLHGIGRQVLRQQQKRQDDF